MNKYLDMKNIFYIVCLSFFLVSSIDAREVSQLEERNGLTYEPNKEKPFTGKYVTYFENGKKEKEGNYKEGEVDGLCGLRMDNTLNTAI